MTVAIPCQFVLYPFDRPFHQGLVNILHECAGTEIVVQESRYAFWQISTLAPVVDADVDELVVDDIPVLASDEVGVVVVVMPCAVVVTEGDKEEADDDVVVVAAAIPLLALVAFRLLSPTPRPTPNATPSTTIAMARSSQTPHIGNPSNLFLGVAVAVASPEYSLFFSACCEYALIYSGAAVCCPGRASRPPTGTASSP